MSYHFVTGDFQPQKVFLPDREYGLALDALVKGCADVLLTRGEGASLRILLGKRKVEPQPDWWFVGGRTRPGDTPAEGAARNVKRELGLAIETRRFVHVNTYSFVWNYRQQAPSSNGTADASTVFELPLTQAEADGLGPSKFDEKEYADAAPSAVISAVAGQSAGPASENAATPAGSASTPAPTIDLTRLTVDAATLAPSSVAASAGAAASEASASSVVLNFCRGATRRGGRRNASDGAARHARTQARLMVAAFCRFNCQSQNRG